MHFNDHRQGVGIILVSVKQGFSYFNLSQFVSQSTNDFHKAPTAETWFSAYVISRKQSGNQRKKNTEQCL